MIVKSVYMQNSMMEYLITIFFQFIRTYMGKLYPQVGRYRSKNPNPKYAIHSAPFTEMPFYFQRMADGDVPIQNNRYEE